MALCAGIRRIGIKYIFEALYRFTKILSVIYLKKYNRHYETKVTIYGSPLVMLYGFSKVKGYRLIEDIYLSRREALNPLGWTDGTAILVPGGRLKIKS